MKKNCVMASLNKNALTLLLCILVLPRLISAVIESKHIRACCDMGITASHNLTVNCSKILVPTTIPKKAVNVCVLAINLCCYSKRQTTHCDRGVNSAKTKPNCNDVLSSQISYKCCKSCKLGLIISETSRGICTIIGNSLAEPWRRTFKRCCLEDTSITEKTVEFTTLVPLNPCPIGYSYNQELNVCDDIDECLNESHECNVDTETCVNTVGDYICESRSIETCPPGYRYFLISCVDIDECLEKTDLCPPKEICINEDGSYRCEKQKEFVLKIKECGLGYKFNENSELCEDINECQIGEHSCIESQRCDNTLGSYTCVRYTTCGTGYTLNHHTGRCDDNDECAMGMDNCASLGRGYLCRNMQGSFRCEKRRCNVGEILNDAGVCTPLQCQTGFIPGELGNCIDIDECKEKVCFRGQTCENTMGSYRCTNQCSVGLRLNPITLQCDDIDECLNGMAACIGRYRTCVNTIGSYNCECSVGFTESSRGQCVDIDECAEDICGVDSVCQNSQGSFRCVCKSGFRTQGDNCIDINECKEIPGICQQGCTNIWGSYMCHCEVGYRLSSDSRSCIDIDECLDFENLCLGNCVNIPGSYQCSCPRGYILSSNERNCEDVDECLDENNICKRKNMYCFNTRGNFKCMDTSCPDGYTPGKSGVSRRCRRISVKCKAKDYTCLRKPVSVSYNFISLISNIKIRGSGGINLFEMQSAKRATLTTKFTLNLKEVRAAKEAANKVDRSYFRVKKRPFRAVITLVKSIEGPQDVVLELMMDMYQHGRYQASAAAKIFIFISPHEF